MRETDDSDLRLDLERAAVMLTAKQRRALWLWCLGYTQEEIAATCQASVWGVRRMLNYGLSTIYVGLT